MFTCKLVAIYATCTFSPAAINLSSTTPAATSLIVSTSANMGDLRPVRLGWEVSSGVFAAIGIPLFFSRRRFAQHPRLLSLLAVALAAATLASCGGASSGTGTGPTTTPAGTYDITILGTGTGVAIQQTVTLVVQ